MSNVNWTTQSEGERQRINRVLSNTTGASGGGYLLQTFINRTVQQLTLREFGLQAVLDRRPGSGDAEYINQRTAGVSGAGWYADTATVDEENGTYEQVSFPYKTAVTRGKVTRKLMAVGRTYADILALELSAKAEDFANQLEEGYLLGQLNYSTNANLNGTNAPKGFLTLLFGDYSLEYLEQVVPVNQTGTTAPGCKGPLTLEKLDTAIDKIKGAASRQDLVIVGSFAGLRQLNGLLQADQVFNDVTEVAGGFRVKTYDGIPCIVSTAMPNDLQFSGLTTATHAGNNVAGRWFEGKASTAASSASMLLILNKRYCYISELTPTTVLPLAKSSSQFDQFDMYWDGAPVISNSLGISAVTNIDVS